MQYIIVDQSLVSSNILQNNINKKKGRSIIRLALKNKKIQKEVRQMEMNFLLEKLSEIQAVIDENLFCPIALIIQINKGLKPQEGDGDIYDAEILIKGNLGNKLNRVEQIINDSELHQETKTIIIKYIEDIRLFYGREPNQD